MSTMTQLLSTLHEIDAGNGALVAPLDREGLLRLKLLHTKAARLCGMLVMEIDEQARQPELSDPVSP